MNEKKRMKEERKKQPFQFFVLSTSIEIVNSM